MIRFRGGRRQREFVDGRTFRLDRGPPRLLDNSSTQPFAQGYSLLRLLLLLVRKLFVEMVLGAAIVIFLGRQNLRRILHLATKDAEGTSVTSVHAVRAPERYLAGIIPPPHRKTVDLVVEAFDAGLTRRLESKDQDIDNVPYVQGTEP